MAVPQTIVGHFCDNPAACLTVVSRLIRAKTGKFATGESIRHWVTVGSFGVKLRAVKCRGAWRSTEDAVDEFLQARDAARLERKKNGGDGQTKEYLTPPELAQLYRVKPATIVAEIKAGRLPAFTLSPPGSSRPRWRISRDAIAEFERSRTATSSDAGNRRARASKRQPATRQWF